MNVGLIGLGAWGKNIARNLDQMGVYAGCYDREYIEDLSPNSYKPYLWLMNGSDAIVIATPPWSHYEWARQALLDDKDVLVEKPMAMTVEQAHQLVELARDRKRILMVGHLLHYHPAVVRLKQLIKDGELGDLRYIYSNRLNSGKLRTDHDVLWSFAPHDISVILSLVGKEPTGVTCKGGAYVSEGIYDTTLTSLEFDGNVKAHIFVSWLHPYKEQRLVVVGSKATAVFDDLAAEPLVMYPQEVEWQDGKVPVIHTAPQRLVGVSVCEPLRAELEHFKDCVENRKTPLTDGEEGLRVVKVLEMAKEDLQHPLWITVKSQSDDSAVRSKVYIHPTAIVDDDAEIGEGTKVWQFSRIFGGCKIGKNCVVGQNCAIGPNVTIGDGCKIQNNVSVYEGVTLEDDVFCGPSCVFTNVINPRAFINRKNEYHKTLVKKGATIGANATIVCGVTLGEYAFVGAGAVVTKDVAEHRLSYGNPTEEKGLVSKRMDW